MNMDWFTQEIASPEALRCVGKYYYYYYYYC